MTGTYLLGAATSSCRHARVMNRQRLYSEPQRQEPNPIILVPPFAIDILPARPIQSTLQIYSRDTRNLVVSIHDLVRICACVRFHPCPLPANFPLCSMSKITNNGTGRNACSIANPQHRDDTIPRDWYTLRRTGPPSGSAGADDPILPRVPRLPRAVQAWPAPDPGKPRLARRRRDAGDAKP